MLDSHDAKLTAYVLGELEPEEMAAVEAQVEQSPELQEAVAAIRETVQTIGAALESEEPARLSLEQQAAIAGAVGGGESTEQSSPSVANAGSVKATTAFAVGVAALVLLAVGVTVGWQQGWFGGEPVVAKNDGDQATNDADEPVVAPITDSVLSPSASDEAWLEAETQLETAPARDLQDAEGLPRQYGAASDPTTNLDFEAAPVEVELSDFGDLSTPRNDLMREITRAQGGRGISGRGPVEQSGTTVQLPRFNFPEDAKPDERFGLDPNGNPTSGPDLDLGLGTEGRSESGQGQAGGREGQPAPGGGQPGADPFSSTPSPADRPQGGVHEAGGEQPDASEEPPTPDSQLPADADSPVSGEDADRPSQNDGGAQANGDAEGERRGRERDGRERNLEDLKENNGEKQPARPEPRTWRRAKATPNASRLIIGERDELPIKGMQANVHIDGFRARVLLDCYYYNDRDRQLEGAFKLRLPNEASLYYFAFGETSYEYQPMVDQVASRGFLDAELLRASGTGPREIMQARSDTWTKVKEARLVPREKAAYAYSETVRRRIDPALVEWSGAGVFNTKVYPLAPQKLHRIVIGYDVNLRQEGENLVYDFDLPEGLPEASVDFNLAAVPGATAEISPQAQPFTASGRAYYHFENPEAKSFQVRYKNVGEVLLTGGDEQTGDYFATRITPNLPAEAAEVGASRAVFLVDTSLSSNPDKFNVWLRLLESSLAENRPQVEEFAVLFFNIEQHWWRGKFVKNTPENVEQLMGDCAKLSLEGATDLHAALAEAARPQWTKKGAKPAATDYFLLSDAAVTWGELDRRVLAAEMATAGGPLFAYKTGLAGTEGDVLEFLARESGGAVFAVASEDEVEQAVTAHRKRPWRLLNATVPGGSDLLLAGRPRSIYPGQSLLLVGRGKPAGEAVLHLRRGDDEKVVRLPLGRPVKSELTPRLYGQVAVGQLEDLGSAIEDVSVAYARHFRVTGRSCSLLMLDNEADYQRFNIKPEDDQIVIKSSPAADLITQKLDELAETLSDPKASVLAWLDKLEKLEGLNYRTPTALKLALDRMPSESFAVPAASLEVKERRRGDLPKEFFELLEAKELDYDKVVAEAQRRKEKYGAADALKALSNLIERNPGDPILAQDVAYTSIEWGLGGQAYPLLQRVAKARPYLPHTYLAIGHCLSELGRGDLAMVYYEVAVSAQWNDRYQDVRSIASVEYARLLRRIAAGEVQASAKQYAEARLASLQGQLPVQKADLVVTMMWNTDRTDVDLHVLEPNGEECYYKNRNTRAGGVISRDVTQGFGPEMYTMAAAQHGKYKVMANYYASDQNRTSVRSKVYLTIYEDFGGRRERATRKVVTLERASQKQDVAEIFIEK